MAETRHPKLKVLLSFLIVVIGVGLAIGLAIQPGPWYAALSKPALNPPNWIFGPAWTVLYILIAITGWRTWRLEGLSSRPMLIWVGQMLLNWIWTPLFFGAHQMAAGLVVIIALLLVILLFIVTDGIPSPGNVRALCALGWLCLGSEWFLNWLFAGSDKGGERAAAILSLIETAKLNTLDLEAYPREVLTRIADHPINGIDELLPWNLDKGSNNVR